MPLLWEGGGKKRTREAGVFLSVVSPPPPTTMIEVTPYMTIEYLTHWHLRCIVNRNWL
jgi:hypothetical protein